MCFFLHFFHYKKKKKNILHVTNVIHCPDLLGTKPFKHIFDKSAIELCVNRFDVEKNICNYSRIYCYTVGYLP